MQVLKNSNINKNDELELFNKSSNELFTEYSIRDIETLNLKLSNTIDVSKDELRTLVGSKYRDLLNVADNIIVMRELSIIQNDKLNNLIFKKSNYNNNKSLVNLNNLNNSIKSNNLSLLKSKNNSIILRNLVHDLNISFFELKFLINNYNNLNDLENKDNKLNKNITNDNSTNNNTASINDSNDDESSINSIQLEKISNHFLELSKQFLLVENLFKDELNTTTFASNKSIKSTVLKFKSLKSNYIKILKLQLQKFLIDNEFEFILNLLLSLSIIKKISPFECLKIFLNLRLNYLNFKFNSVSNINNCLYYIFNTLSYISIFRSKLSTHLIRIFYSSNNQFNNSNNKTNNNTNSNINNPNLNLILKFSKWLDVDSTNFKFEFPLNILQIKNSINKLKIEDECNDFKLKISDFLLNLFKKNLLLNNNNLNDLSTILLKFLNSFKKFSSLIDLKINENENLIENLINLWNSKYIEILEKNLLKFNNIKLIINQNFLNNNIIDFKNILINKNNNPLLSIGNNLFQITELSKINDYIINLQSSNDQHSSATPTTTITASTIISNEELLSNINIYKSILNSSFKSIQLISKLSSTISKPILSIDDYEDDEYWENISLKLISITNNLIEFNINKINESIRLFITDINNDINYFENSNANNKNANENSKLYLLKLFYLIKILISLISNLNISSILFKFINSFINNKKTNEVENKNFEIEIVNFNDILYPILLKLFEILTDILSTSSLENLKNIIKSRLSTSNKYTEIEEKILWDGFISLSSSSSSLDNNNDYSTLLPNCNSIDVECLLFELSNNFKSGGKILNFTEGEDEEEEESEEIFDFTDIYLVNEFKQANKELIRKLVKSISDGIVEKDESIKDITFESVENTETESDEITKPDENTEDNSTTATTADAEVDTDTGTGAGANVTAKDEEESVPIETTNMEQANQLEPVKPEQVSESIEDTVDEREPTPNTHYDEKEDYRSILTYTDIIMIACFQLSDNELEESVLNKLIESDETIKNSINKLSQIDNRLNNENYRLMINKNILDNYKTKKLLFNPLFV